MSNLIFNPPYGWPVPPKDWRPSEDWKPNPSWPAPPAGWIFWVQEDAAIAEPKRKVLPPPVLSTSIKPVYPPKTGYPSVASTPAINTLNQPENEVLFNKLGVDEQSTVALIPSASQAALLKTNIDQIIHSTKRVTPAIRQDLLHKINSLNNLQTQALNELKNAFRQDTEIYNKIEAVDNARSFNKLLLEKQQALQNFQLQEDKVVEQKIKELNAIQIQIEQLKSELIEVNDRVSLQEVSLHEYFNPAENSVDLKKELDNVKAKIKAMITSKKAINATANFTYNNSTTEGSKFVKEFGALMLTAYNQEIENTIVKAARGKDIYAALDRADKASSKVEKMGTMLNMSVTPEYHSLRRREIELAFKYKERDAQEKEEERTRKAELREEEKIAREAEARSREILKEEKALLLELKAKEMAKEVQKQEILQKIEANRIAGLDKEESHYRNVLAQLEVDDPAVLELKLQLNKVELAKETNSSILANTKAGYVYVISNVGSFGEGVVKIGLTRRSEPMDRVKELGDASVPFIFDVHIIHFSDDAVTLEKALHHKFAKQAINKVNFRKEFFRVRPEEVRDALAQLSNGALLTFNEIPEANDYRMTLKLEGSSN